MFVFKGIELGYSPENHINFTNNGKCSPLHLAVQSRDLEMIKMCIEYGAQIDLKQVKSNKTNVYFSTSIVINTYSFKFLLKELDIAHNSCIAIFYCMFSYSNSILII